MTTVKVLRKALYPICAWALVFSCSLFLGIWSITSTARAVTCIYRLLKTSQVQGSYTLRTDLYGAYSSSGAFCTEMYAKADLVTPARGVDGTLDVYLTNCHDNDLLQQEASVSVGGQHGQHIQLVTGPVSNSCGYASAAFQGNYQDPLFIGVHTDAIDACTTACHPWGIG